MSEKVGEIQGAILGHLVDLGKHSLPHYLMRYFEYAHLPPHLQQVSKPICEIAKLMDDALPNGTEKDEGMRKLLEAKDCFVRQAVGMVKPMDAGELSDGYHTFNALYLHRMYLFAVICRSNPVIAWKSKLHHDGTMFPDYFIVGIQTPQGQFTYHYHVKHWDMFPVQERENAPEWDGHTASDVSRLLSLPFFVWVDLGIETPFKLHD